MRLICPEDENPCDCLCCKVGGCMANKHRIPMLIECQDCGEAVTAEEFESQRCIECAHRIYAEAWQP